MKETDKKHVHPEITPRMKENARSSQQNVNLHQNTKQKNVLWRNDF